MNEYAVVQTLNFDSMGGEWLETEIVFQGNLTQCRNALVDLVRQTKHIYETTYSETDVLALPIEKYSSGWAYHVGCLNNPTLWAEFIIAEISLDKRGNL